MNFRTATLLVLGMFGSFAVVIATMMVLFWSPGGKKTAQKAPPPEAAQPARILETEGTTTPNQLVQEQPAPETALSGSEPRGERFASTPEPPAQERPEIRKDQPKTPVPRPLPGKKTQRELQIELKEYRLLREEMDRRLREQEKRQERKLDQLARQCENLGAGETVQILIPYTDELIKRVLERMSREKAIEVATLLKRLGRADAISIK